jgi:hypothetical protein
MHEQTENAADPPMDQPNGEESVAANDSSVTGVSESQEAPENNDILNAQGSPVPAQDSGDGIIKKEEDGSAVKKEDPRPPWRRELDRFHNDINEILATKENFKLVAVDQNAKPSFARSWKQEANRYFQLIVNLRRRGKGAKVGGKNVA